MQVQHLTKSQNLQLVAHTKLEAKHLNNLIYKPLAIRWLAQLEHCQISFIIEQLSFNWS